MTHNCIFSLIYFKQDYLAIFKSLWKSSASQLLSLSVVDTERFHSMLSRKKEEVLNIVHGVDVERKEVSFINEFFSTLLSFCFRYCRH